MPRADRISFLMGEIGSLHERLCGPVVLSNSALERNRVIQFLQSQINLAALGVNGSPVAHDARLDSGAKYLEDVGVTAFRQRFSYLGGLLVILQSSFQISFFLAYLAESHQVHRLRNSVEGDRHVAGLRLKFLML